MFGCRVMSCDLMHPLSSTTLSTLTRAHTDLSFLLTHHHTQTHDLTQQLKLCDATHTRTRHAHEHHMITTRLRERHEPVQHVIMRWTRTHAIVQLARDVCHAYTQLLHTRTSTCSVCHRAYHISSPAHATSAVHACVSHPMAQHEWDVWCDMNTVRSDAPLM